MLEKDLRNEKGSITLFVLLAMLFFLIVIFGMFMTSSNKNSIQVSELDKIKKEYGESVDNIDQIYANIIETREKTIDDLKAGDRVYYDTGNTSIGDEGVIECIVLYDKAYNDENGTDYGIQMISADTIDTVTLGSSDFNASRDSYNNAIITLNEKAEEYLNTTYASNARCVGSVPDNKNVQSGWHRRWDTWFTPYNNTFIDTDKNYNADYKQIGAGNLNIATIGKYYWLASHYVQINSFSSNFQIRCIGSNGAIGAISVIYVGDSTTRIKQ